MIKAICVGRLCYDIILQVDQMPASGTTTEFFEKAGSVGGTGGIVSFCLSKWGIKTSIAGVLGNDYNGTRIRKELEQAHVDTRYIEPSYDNDTPISVIVTDKTTKNHTIYNISDKFVSLKKCDYDFTPDIIFADGYDSVSSKMTLERFPNTPSVIDASIITTSVLELLKKAKYSILTKEFAEAASGLKMDFQHTETLVSVYQKLKKRYSRTEIIITLGEHGVLYCSNNQIKISPILKVDTIDTYGAGAIFRAAFTHAIAASGDIEKAVKFGAIAAALSTTAYGAKNAIPTIEEINKLYEQNY